MGLDMFVYGISKVKENEIPANPTPEWLDKHNYRYCVADDGDFDAESPNPRTADLLPWSVVREVDCVEVDWNKVRSDNGLSHDAFVVGIMKDISGSTYLIRDKAREVAIRNPEESEQYRLTRKRQLLIYRADELAYWRKEYDLQAFFYARIDDLDNVTYAEINPELFRDLKQYLFGKGMDLQKLEKAYDAYMYYEWY